MSPSGSGDVRVEGLDELAEGTEALGEEIARKIPRAAEDPARALLGRVQSQVPRLTGAMANDLAVLEHDGNTAVGYQGEVEYEGWVEFGGTWGRSYVELGRYLYPESQNSETEFERAIETLTEQEIGSHRWPPPSPT